MIAKLWSVEVTKDQQIVKSVAKTLGVIDGVLGIKGLNPNAKRVIRELKREWLNLFPQLYDETIDEALEKPNAIA